MYGRVGNRVHIKFPDKFPIWSSLSTSYDSYLLCVIFNEPDLGRDIFIEFNLILLLIVVIQLKIFFCIILVLLESSMGMEYFS